MPNLGDVVVKLRADLKNFTAGMTKASGIVKSFGGVVQSAMRVATQSVIHFAQTVKRYMKIATLALTAYLVQSVRLASRVQEAENFFVVSFKNMAAAARRWSEEFSRALFLNASDVRKYMVTYNEMLQGMGLMPDAAFEMSKGLTQITFDLASFRDLEMDEAFQKLTSALAGMSRPMLNLGYNIQEAALQEEALHRGITKSVEDMSQAEKVALRYAVINDRLRNAFGDLFRTIDDGANVWKTLKEQIKDVSEAIGDVMLDDLTRMGKAMREWLQENKEAIALTYRVFWENMKRIVEFIKSDWKAAWDLASSIMVETMRFGFESVMIIARHTFIELGKRIPEWIREGMPKTGDLLDMVLRPGEATLRRQAGLRAEAVQEYLRQQGADPAAQARLNMLRRIQAGEEGGRFGSLGEAGMYIGGKMTRYRDPALMQSLMAGADQRFAQGHVAGATMLEKVGRDLSAAQATYNASIKAMLDAAKAQGLDLKSFDEVKAEQNTKRIFDTVTGWLGETADKVKSFWNRWVESQKPAADKTQETWQKVWDDVSKTMAQSMEGAFADIMEDIHNLEDALTNMLKSIQRALSQAIFRQYLGQPIFGALSNLIPGANLTYPQQQAPGVQEQTYLRKGGIVYARRGFAARGTDTVPAMLSPGETVVPEDISAFFRKVGWAGQQQPQPQPVTINVNAVDAQSTYQWFNKNKRMLASMVGAAGMNNHPIRRG